MTKLINEAAAGAAELGFSAETRAEWVASLKKAQADLAEVESKIQLMEPQGKIDREKRHAHDIEDAQAYRRKQQKLKM